MAQTMASRRAPTGSLSTRAEMAVANRIEVSRSAATTATGATVMAQRVVA